MFAPEGSVIPVSGEVLKKATIRGVASVGMLCSMRELKLGDEHDGIIELPADAEVGAPAVKALGLEGPVIEIKLTPDRSDCFGVSGIARDLAAAGLGRLRPRDFSPVPDEGAPGPAIGFDFPAGEEKACPLFVGRIIRGVRNGPSPSWLRNRLKAIGLRPISALVDITNYLTFDLCRPLHVFDAGKLDGDLVLRFARPGEELHALDGKTYRLDDGMTVIADAAGRSASAASWAARHRRDRGRPPISYSRWRCSIRCAPLPPAAGSASRVMPARASSAGSTRRSSCRPPSSRRG